MYNILIINKNYEQKYKIKNIPIANSFMKRFLGLMGKNKFSGLIFKQKHTDKYSNSIHTCFMKAPIDIIYINNEMKIQEITTLKPWKLYIPKKGNIKYIIELPENSVNKHHIKLDDIVILYEQKKN